MTRTFLLILLIAVLPLRGWTAERMADHMAANSGAASQHATTGAMPADCPMMLQMAVKAGAMQDPATDDDSAAPTTSSERTCQSCQLCMSLAAPETTAVQAASPAPQTLAVHSAYRFASADLPRSIKPPIS